MLEKKFYRFDLLAFKIGMVDDIRLLFCELFA